MRGLCVCRCVHQTWPGGKMASPTMIGPPPPSPPRRASNLRPCDETPVHFQYATLPMWWETPPIPPAVGTWQSLGGGTRFSPRPRGTLHQHQHAHRAACAVASTSRGDAAHCEAGPPCTFRYAPPSFPTANNPPRWIPSIYYHNTRTTHCEPPQATLRASNPGRPASGPLMIPLYYTEDT